MLKHIKIFFLKIVFLIYLAIPQKKISINLNNLNFRNIDFVNYKKIRLLIFKKKFINENTEPAIYNFDFINYCNKIGGKKGIEIAKKNIFKWHRINKFKNNITWQSENISKRILNLVYNFDYINSISSPNEEKNLKKIIKENIKRFNLEIYLKKSNLISLLELKTKILINIILNKKKL